MNNLQLTWKFKKYRTWVTKKENENFLCQLLCLFFFFSLRMGSVAFSVQLLMTYHNLG